MMMYLSQKPRFTLSQPSICHKGLLFAAISETQKVFSPLSALSQLSTCHSCHKSLVLPSLMMARDEQKFNLMKMSPCEVF